MLRVLASDYGLEARWFAGHSLGEYTALVAAGALTFRDSLPLVRFRAQAMQEAVPDGQGGMAAILGLSEVEAQKGCAEAGGIASDDDQCHRRAYSSWFIFWTKSRMSKVLILRSG